MQLIGRGLLYQQGLPVQAFGLTVGVETWGNEAIPANWRLAQLRPSRMNVLSN
jgi:hypothetical protein